jgi:hypothetical protein
MKSIFVILALLLPTFTFVSHQSKWIPVKNYLFLAEHKKVFNIIKTWASFRYQTDFENYDFEYAINETELGFKAEVTPLFISKNGKYAYMIDGEMCIDLDSKFNLVQEYQCGFPPYPDVSTKKIAN